MKNIVRRLFCSVMSITILSVSLPPVTAQTEETEPFPYTIYSRYSTSISSAQLCVNGNLHANAGVSFQSSNMNLNGAVTSENETDGKIEPVYADQRIIETFFPEQTVYNTDSYSCEDTNVAVNQTVFSYEEIELNGNTNLNASIGAYDNIEINGNCFTSNQVVLYSGFGNVTITADSSVSLNGLIYAPFGTVTLSAPNVSVNGIIIAENVLIQSGNANINKNDYFARFIGTVSDGYDFSQIPEKYNGDSDDDELPDIYEKIIGTDPINFDTDGDALPDGYEVIHLGTDPLFVDTDDNGISDPDEDFDEDGLCNLDEYLNETDPYDPDSDMDGYTDGDEVELYLTDPANPDSDDDGLLDGDEGADGFIYTTYGILFDPLLPDTDGNGISDGAEQFAQTYTYYEEDEDSAVRAVSIDMVAAGVLQNHTNIENILDMDVMCSGVVGLIGAPYDIETLDVTGTATLRFTVDPDKLEDTQLSDLMFLWYDEENDEFVELETSIDEDTNTVSTVVSHFSKYMIVNKIKWFEAWQKEFNYTTSSYDRPICHTVLAIDCSASMLSNDPGSGIGTYRYLAVCNFIDSMDENDKAAIVKYNSNASVICNLTDNKAQLKDKAKAINSSGKTSFDSALLAAVSELKSNIIAPNTRNYIVLLSDGESSVSASTWVELAKCNNLVIHTVCLRAKNATTAEEIQKQKNAEATLVEIANRGHGTPYIAKTAEDLDKLYTQVGLGISIDPTDNDADGLPDILEIVGIRCSNGVTVTSDPTLADTDGDGLLDGQEISKDSLRVKTFHCYHEGGRSICFAMRSDPNKVDTDGDTISDNLDVNKITSDNIGDLFASYVNNMYISMDSLFSTGDGFTICLTPLCEILKKMGYPENGLAPRYYKEESHAGISYYFDDWYIFNVKDHGTAVYGLIKLREKEFDQYSSVSIPFISFNTNLLSRYSNQKDTSHLQEELVEITEGKRLEHSEVLTNYFSNNSAEALNRLADIYISIVVSKECISTHHLLVDTDKDNRPDEYSMETLNKYSISNTNGNERIYDSEQNLVIISNKSNLTLAEKQCILAIRSSNPSINSFAAEIVYHAEKTNEYSWSKNSPGLNYIYKAAIKADLGIGEEQYGIAASQYKEYNGNYVKAQRQKWGDM